MFESLQSVFSEEKKYLCNHVVFNDLPEAVRATSGPMNYNTPCGIEKQTTNVTNSMLVEFRRCTKIGLFCYVILEFYINKYVLIVT